MVKNTHGMPYDKIESDALFTVSLREQLEQPEQASMSQIDSDVWEMPSRGLCRANYEVSFV